MRIRRFTMDGYGFPVETASLRPVPTPQPFRGFSGAWEDWCDVNYYTPENNAKCKNCNRVEIPFVGPKCTWPAPHTLVGRQLRNLPAQTDLERLGPPGGAGTPPVEEIEIPDAGGGSWFEDNKALIGIGAAGLLGLALLGRRRGRGFMGLGSTKRRRKRRN